MDDELAKKHLGYSNFKIGEDEFKINSLGTDDLLLVMRVQNKLNKHIKANEKLLESERTDEFPEDAVKDIIEMCDKTFKVSYPEWDENLRKSFIASNFVTVMKEVISLNQFGARENSTDRELKNRVKALQANMNVPRVDKQVEGG